MLARSIAALTCASLTIASPVLAEPPRDEFEPVTITPVERPTEPAPPFVVVEPPPPLVVADSPAPSPPAEPPSCLADRRCRGMRIAGVVVGVVGLAAVGTGIGLVARPDQVIPETPAFVTSTRPPGLVALTIGVGVTLTAVLVLVASRSATRGSARAQRVRLDAAGLRF
ncbi:hypothetical protein ACNOYE_23170 [Nannocystaceae bacterium ST9]